MDKYIYTLLAALLTLAIPACTDKDDVEIKYETTVGVSAAHIFDNYEPFVDGDFDMTKEGWKLNLKVLVYDKSGTLVNQAEKLCNSLSESLQFAPSLVPGEYTVVSIADFREGLGGTNYKFWNISNETNLQGLSITENSSYYPVVFETLGLDVQEITVSDKPCMITADIKPATSLVEIFMSDKDYSGWGINGYSRFSVLAEGYFIRAIKAKNNVRFDNGAPSFNYSEQQSDYNLAISSPYEKWSDKKAATSYCYRALLPEKEKGFTYHIQKRELNKADYDTFSSFCGEFDTDGKSNVLPEISSNKQYVVNMILDSFQLIAMEMPADYKHEVYTEASVKEYNRGLMSKMVDTKYENMLGKDEAFANLFLDMKPSDHVTTESLFQANYPHSNANHFENYITNAYLNSDYSNCAVVQLLLPTLSDDDFEHLTQLLSAKFQPEEAGKFGPNYTTFIESGKSEDDSRYRVVLEKHYEESFGQYAYFLQYHLRSKYY